MANTKSKRSGIFWKYSVVFWSIILLGIVGIVIFMQLIASGWLGSLPTFEELENPENALATEVYTGDHVLLGKYFSENRSNATFEELPQNLVQALLATEDIRYYQHAGIDFWAVLRVIAKAGRAGGGSTVTQQLAKNLFHDRPKSTLERALQKLKEWIIAVRLERYYTKEEIMQMYLNTVEFSNNAYGIKSAAKTYFNKPVDSLNVQESAVLVGMLKAPTAYNPRSRYDNSIFRRNVVLEQMYRYKYITSVEKDSLKSLPIELNFQRTDHVDGSAPYFREFLRMELMKWAKNNKKIDGSSYNIYKDGLRIYTTLDSKMQQYAEEAVEDHLSDFQEIFFKHWQGKDPWKEFPNEWKRVVQDSERYRTLKALGVSEDSINIEMSTPIPMQVFSWKGEKDTIMSPLDSIKYHRMFLQTGFMAMDPVSGEVKAWVGGINYKYFQYDHVNINTKRQIGSTFKPFVYAEAIDNGWSPCFQVLDLPVTFEKFNDWTPKNSDNKFTGIKYTLKRGLAESKNSVTAYIMKQIGPQPVIDRVRKMGITSHMDPYPSIALGSADISVYEMVGSYSTYANHGVYTKPLYITRIEDKNGNIIQEFPVEKREVLSEQTAYVMVEMLKNNLVYIKGVNEGTGTRLRGRYGLQNEIGGKTGTTQNQSDGWFIGITPPLIAGAWVGGEDRFVRFRSIQHGQGASMALPIWGRFFQKVYADASTGIDKNAKFPLPQSPLTIEMDCRKYNYEQNQQQQHDVYGSQFESSGN